MTTRIVHIGFVLVCLLNKVIGQLTIRSSTFECGKTGSIVCSTTSDNVANMRWFINGNSNQLCSPTSCLFPSNEIYQYNADSGVWTLTKVQVERKDNNTTFKCETYSSGNERLSNVSHTATVSVLIDNSSNLTTYENDTDTMFTAESNCIKPIENVRITMQCVLASDESVIVPFCRPTTPSSYISECNDLNEPCAGPGTYRKRSVVKLATYRGNFFKLVKIKAVFTDGTNLIEKISGQMKQEIPPKIAPLGDCRVIENTDFTKNCILSSGDPSTVKCTWIAPRGTFSNECSLQIPRVQRTSSGTYTCHVENSVGNDTRSFYLDILYPPEKPVLEIVDNDVTDSIANVLKNTPVIIKCSSFAKPNISSYTWEPAEGSVDGQPQITNTLSPFTRKYTCTVTNYMNQSCGRNGEQGSNSSSVNVHIVYPPEEQAVIFNGSHKIDTTGYISVVRGQSFNLICSAKSDPASTYRWDKTTHDGGLVSISNIILDQSHTCTASNEMRLYNGSTVVGDSKFTVHIEVIYAPSVHTMRHQRIIEGSYFSQICNTTLGRPITTYYLWTRRNGSLSENKRDLTITNVTTEHADNYICTAWNILNPSYGITSNGTDQKTFPLDILYSPKLKAIPNQSVMEGSSFTQNCEFLRRGNPSGKIIWFSLGQAGNEVPIRSANGPLTIANVSRNDQGSFKCVTENSMEPTDKEKVKGTDFKIFYLNVFYTTSISSLTINGTAEEMIVNQNTADVRFMCNVSSNPLSAISLHTKTHNGSMTLQEEQYSDHLLYSLSTATCWDSGVYTCFGRNNVTEKQVSKAVKLLVECTARPLHKTEQNITFYRSVGDDVTFNLTVVSYPLPASELFQWTRVHKEQTITHFKGSIVNLSDSSLESSLTLKDIQEGEFGQYKLTIKYNSTMDAFVQYFFISAQDKPQVPENFVHIEEKRTTTTAVLKWTPGFNGGVRQVFYILYKKASDSTWSHIIVSSPPVTLTGLDPSTLYNVYMFASNGLGNSSQTITLNITTAQAIEEPQSLNNAAIIGGAAATVILLVAAVVLLVVFIRRLSANKSRQSADSKRRKVDGHDLHDPTTGTHGQSGTNEYYNTSRDTYDELQTCSSSGPYEDLNPSSTTEHAYGTLNRNNDEKTSALPTSSTYENLRLTPFK